MKGPERPVGMEEPVHLDVEREKDRLRKRRDSQLWNVVVGIGLMFAGTLFAYLAVGGAFMVVFGGVSYFYWNRRLTHLDDPWKDPEIDAWEEEHFGKL